jgi:hypothetical protein
LPAILEVVAAALAHEFVANTTKIESTYERVDAVKSGPE